MCWLQCWRDYLWLTKLKSESYATSIEFRSVQAEHLQMRDRQRDEWQCESHWKEWSAWWHCVIWLCIFFLMLLISLMMKLYSADRENEADEISDKKLSDLINS